MNYEVYGVARNFIKNETKIFEEYENFSLLTATPNRLPATII